MLARVLISYWDCGPVAVGLVFRHLSVLVMVLTCWASADCCAVEAEKLVPSEVAKERVKESQKNNSDARAEKVNRQEATTAEEAAALALVERHLGELTPILKSLRSSNQRAYEKAIADLARSAKRLQTAKHRDSRFYELELSSLKAKTEIDLMTAKLKVRDRSGDRERLRNAISRYHDLSNRRLEFEISQQEQRLKNLNKQLQSAKDRLADNQQKLNDQIDKSYRRSLRKAGRDETQNP